MASYPLNHRVVLGGLARNCADYLPACLAWLREAYRFFHPESKFLFITNDSTDTTPAILDEFAASFPSGIVKIYKLDGLQSKKPSRTDRLAFCRNMFLNHIQSNHPDYDYMLLADLDDTTANFDPQRIRTCFDVSQTPAQWDALTAAAKPAYYDIWALRSSHLGLTYDCWDAIRHEMRKGLTQTQAIQKHIDVWRIPHETMTEPMEVESAFGGVGIYRISSTRGCQYRGIATECSLGEPAPYCLREICEHVPFHQQMRERNGARIWIFPPLYVTPLK